VSAFIVHDIQKQAILLTKLLGVSRAGGGKCLEGDMRYLGFLEYSVSRSGCWLPGCAPVMEIHQPIHLCALCNCGTQLSYSLNI
jgi:hypothetical protein